MCRSGRKTCFYTVLNIVICAENSDFRQVHRCGQTFAKLVSKAVVSHFHSREIQDERSRGDELLQDIFRALSRHQEVPVFMKVDCHVLLIRAVILLKSMLFSTIISRVTTVPIHAANSSVE